MPGTRKKRYFALSTVVLLGCLLGLPPLGQAMAKIKLDEEIILFPTSAHLSAAGDAWVIPLHGWVFEREPGSYWRRELLEDLGEALELEPSSTENALFQQRGRQFLVDNERGKQPILRLAGTTVRMPRSQPNGHFRTTVRIPRQQLPDANGGTWVKVDTVLPAGDARVFQGQVQLLPSHGISVISDIDDTIKHSQVLDKKALLANTFLRPYQAVTGMPQAYRAWSERGWALHYVSSSPWQLYPSLSEFLAQQGFPAGSWHLRDFRFKDQSFFNLFASSIKTKTPVIEGILQAYPQRRFVLVGDAGEQDPQIYAAIAQRFPQQIAHVFIRDLGADPDLAARMTQLFAGMSDKRWTVFTDAKSLASWQP